MKKTFFYMALAYAVSNPLFASSKDGLTGLSTEDKNTQNCMRLTFENAVGLRETRELHDSSRALQLLEKGTKAVEIIDGFPIKKEPILKDCNLRVALKNSKEAYGTRPYTEDTNKFFAEIYSKTVNKDFISRNQEFFKTNPDIVSYLANLLIDYPALFQVRSNHELLFPFLKPEAAGKLAILCQGFEGNLVIPGHYSEKLSSFFTHLINKAQGLPLGERQRLYTKLSRIPVGTNTFSIYGSLLKNSRLFNYATGAQFRKYFFMNLIKHPNYLLSQFHKRISALVNHPESKRFLLSKDWGKLRQIVAFLFRERMHGIAVGPEIYEDKDKTLQAILEKNPEIKVQNPDKNYKKNRIKKKKNRKFPPQLSLPLPPSTSLAQKGGNDLKEDFKKASGK